MDVEENVVDASKNEGGTTPKPNTADLTDVGVGRGLP